MKDDLIALRERVQTLVEGEPRHPDYMSMNPAELGGLVVEAMKIIQAHGHAMTAYHKSGHPVPRAALAGSMCLGAGLLALVDARIARYEEELQ